MYAKQNKTPSKLWSFKDQAENKSMINTPPTFGVYILLEIFRWLEAQGGLGAMEQRNATKANLIYDSKAIKELKTYAGATPTRNTFRVLPIGQ